MSAVVVLTVGARLPSVNLPPAGCVSGVMGNCPPLRDNGFTQQCGVQIGPVATGRRTIANC